MSSATVAQAVDACVRRIVQQPDFPAFSESIQQVIRLAADEEASVQQLTNAILRDVSLTLKTLRAANSVYYNRSGKPILSVSHAVALLGVEAIRDLAAGLTLFEQIRRRSAGLRELVVLSLLTAHHARALAEHLAYPRLEEAYLCGMFRNLGELLIAAYQPHEHAAILGCLAAGKLSVYAAAMQVLGFRYEDLGRAMAQHWGMPEKVSACQQVSAQMGQLAARGELGTLQALTSFSHALTAVAYRREPTGVSTSLRLLLADYGPVLSLGPRQLQEITETAIAETKDTFAVSGVPLDDLRLRRQSERMIEALKAEEAAAAPQENLLERLTAEAEAVLDAGGNFDTNSLLLMVVEALYRGGPFDHVLFALVDPDHEHVRGRIGLGQNVEDALGKFAFRMSLRGGPVSVALLRKQDLLVDTSRAAHAEQLELAGALGVPFLGLYPVVVEGLLVGCLYFDCQKPRGALSEAETALFGRLRNCVVRAIQRKRHLA